MKMLFIIMAISSVILLFSVTVLTAHAQPDLQTTKYRNMVIDLGNGLETNARLNLPANGDGPFPGALLIAGSGIADMNETGGYVRIDNETGSKLYPLLDRYLISPNIFQKEALQFCSMTREV